MLKAKAKGSKAYNKMAELISAKDADKMTRYFTEYGSQLGAEDQIVLVLTAQEVRGPNSNPTLADVIVTQQCHKVVEWGKKAYPLTEKQIAVIVRDLM